MGSTNGQEDQPNQVKEEIGSVFKEGGLFTGSCLCETVKYEIKGAATLQYLCLCRNCQKLSGSAFQANLFFPRAGFHVLSGEDNLSVYDCDRTGSGALTRRNFCKKCGSPLFILPDSKPEVIVICGGSLDDFDKVVPTQEVWTKRRQSWMKPLENVECFEESRPIMSGRQKVK